MSVIPNVLAERYASAAMKSIWSGGDVTANTAASFSMTGNEARDGGGGAIYSDGNVKMCIRDSSSIMGKLCREGHAEEDFGCLAEQFD